MRATAGTPDPRDLPDPPDLTLRLKPSRSGVGPTRPTRLRSRVLARCELRRAPRDLPDPPDLTLRLKPSRSGVGPTRPTRLRSRVVADASYGGHARPTWTYLT